MINQLFNCHYSYLIILLIFELGCGGNDLNPDAILAEGQLGEQGIDATQQENLTPTQAIIASNTTDNPLGNLGIFSTEILQHVLYHIGLDHVGLEDMQKVRSLNKTFYYLTTGYKNPGVCGIEHKPEPNLLAGLLKSDRSLYFGESALTVNLHTMPSFIFFQTTGTVRHLLSNDAVSPITFCNQLKDTYIHTLD